MGALPLSGEWRRLFPMDPMEVAFFIFMGAAAIVGSTVASMNRKKQDERRAQVWRAFAERRGGRCNEQSGGFVATRPPESIDIRLAHAEVRLDVVRESNGNTTIDVTRARARFVIGAGPAFEVTQAGLLSGLARNLGVQDLDLGNASFRYHFTVKGNDLDGTKAAWTGPIQRTLAERFPSATVWSDGTLVRLTLAGALEDPARLNAVLDVVSALASVGVAELQAFAELPEATLVPASGPWDEPSAPQVRLATVHGQATATLRWMKGGPRVWLSLPTTRDLPPFRVVVQQGTADALPTGLVSEYAARLLGALDGVLLLSEDGKLDVRWLGIPTSEGLMAGAKLLGELAGGTHHVGAFR